MPYQVQKGDTIAKVTNLMKTNWKTLRRLNPNAVGQSSRSGHWFLKEGAVIKGEETFESLLRQKEGTANNPSSSTVNSTRSEQWTEYTIKRGDTLWSLAVNRFHVQVDDLIQDNGIKDPRRLQPGQRIRIRIPSYPDQQEVVASWYGRYHHGKRMANGDFFNMHGATIAHRKLPLGTRVELENLSTGERAKAVVTDRGPYVAGRDVDISYGLARKLSLVKKGVGSLVMRILG